MKKLLLLTIMCLFGLSASLKAQCPVPQNLKAKTELNAAGYDKKYKITCTWDAVSGAQGYAVYVSTQYYPDGMWMGNVWTGTEFVMGSNVEGQLYFSVLTICDDANGIVSDRSEEVSVILSEDVQLNYDIVASVNPENAGTVTGDGYYDVNDVVTLIASANAGYKFVNWTENGEVVSTESQYLFTFTTQRELVANFEVKEEEEDNTENTEFVSKEQQKRNVLIEELTGRNCQYCPDGHAIANELVKNNPDRVWAINIHSGGYAPTNYPNLNTTASAAICNAFTTGSFPSGIVNRSTTTAENRGMWASTTSQQLSQNAECNIGGKIVINKETRIAAATVEVYYTGNSTSENNYLTIMMLQDSILGSQSGGSTWNPSQMIDGQYVHMHVLRDVVTSTWGDRIAPTTAGTLITKTYTYEIPKTIGSPNGVDVDLNNIHFIALVSEKQDNSNSSAYDIPTRPILNVNQLPIVEGKDVNITATVNPENAGTVTGTGTYKEVETVTLTATANDGYRFLNWTENGNVVSNQATYLFMATKDRNLVANFESSSIVRYNVTATANPEIAGTVTGEGSYIENETVTLTATANEGYEFLNWTENGEIVSEESEYSFTITSDRNLVANFIATEGIDELSSAFNLYPNPANDNLYIDAKVKINEVVIYDVYGRSQQSTVNSQQSLSIDVSNFNSGIYFVKIVTDNGEVVKRFVKQ